MNQLLPSLCAALFGTARASSKQHAEPPLQGTTDATSEPEQQKAACPHGYRWRQRQSRPPGICRYRKARQILSNPKFMHRSQRARFAKGETIYV